MIFSMGAIDDLRDGLVQTSFTVIAALSRVAADQDLSLTQLRMLGILRDREPAMAELATYLGLERSTVSGLIDRAVARGLVRRPPMPPTAVRCASASPPRRDGWKRASSPRSAI